jgi:transposase
MTFGVSEADIIRASPDPIESLGSQISFVLIQGSPDLEGALMPRTLSVDLRQRVLDAVAAGATHREAGQRLSVSAASVSRWKAQQRASSTLAPKPRGGDRRSAGTDQHKQAILEALGPDKDRTLEEIREILAQQKIALGTSTLDRFFARHGITRKKRQPTPSSRTAPTF